LFRLYICRGGSHDKAEELRALANAQSETR